MKVIQLDNYIQDSAKLFDLIADEYWSQFLDSGVSFNPEYCKGSTYNPNNSENSHKELREVNDISRSESGFDNKNINDQHLGVDILVCRPQSVLLTNDDNTRHFAVNIGGETPSTTEEIITNDIIDLSLIDSTYENPFIYLKNVLEQSRKHFELNDESLVSKDANQVPFWCGAVGYFGYELSRHIESLPTNAADDLGLPDMAVGIYETAIVTCHHSHRSWLVDISGKNHDMRNFWLGKIERFEAEQSPKISIDNAWRSISPLGMSYSQQAYFDKFNQIQHYLHEGDCYQVNLTNRFHAEVSGSPWQSYLKMRALSSAPYGAYMNFPFAQILSNSPERFIECKQGQVRTSPIKGTRPRNLDDQTQDEALAEELQQSEKDRAENVMIVDLLRNDLGRVCEIGSVDVPELFAIESFANVHHLVSHIRGELSTDTHALDLLASCFPGGSITGAPKNRAMEVIDEIEPNCRGVYCGAIAWIDFSGNMQSNIAIRTITHINGECYFSAGGGIVVDSKAEEEMQELYDKAKVMLKTVGLNSI